MPKIGEILFGKRSKTKKKTTINANQDELLRLITEGLSKGTGPFADIFGPFNEESFNKGVYEPQLKKFNEETLPMLQEKFIAGNQALGSGMRRGQLKAAGDFQSRMAELLYQAQQDQAKNRLTGAQTALGVKPFENIVKGESKGLLPSAASGAANAVTSAIAG